MHLLTAQVYSSRIQNTETKATQDYKTTILDALHTLETNIDTIQSANYRENMLALVLVTRTHYVT